MDTDDFIIWRWDPKHVFKTKSTYFCLVSSSWDSTNPCWADIWKAQVLQRLRLFLWIAFKDRLMNNLERCRRSVGHHPSCTICDTQDESTPMSCVIASSPVRNEHVFNSVPQSPTDVWSKGISWARCYMESFLSSPTRSPESRTSHWIGPELGWGFQKAIGVLQPLQAVLWALLIGLRFTWDQGFVFVQIQSDCVEAVKLINIDNACISPISLVRAITALRHKAWATEITWIPRTSNLSVDMLAKSVDPNSTDFHELAEPPAALMHLLSMDALHMSL
ncbi:hypothetical protein V6N11_082799 [Hibiscus sabdariffa]|uniref:RNase H type-1 domain-containing protein n=1 Tax=Hibiscus sabdariffa TaxID=183260 RepID=A0ABR2QJY3_9ROSI